MSTIKTTPGRTSRLSANLRDQLASGGDSQSPQERFSKDFLAEGGEGDASIEKPEPPVPAPAKPVAPKPAPPAPTTTKVNLVNGKWVRRTFRLHPEQPKALEKIRLALQSAEHEDLDVSDPLTEELKAYAKTNLLPHKYACTVVYLDALPKTGSGKIDRQALRDQA